jgi:hypothetical protein
VFQGFSSIVIIDSISAELAAYERDRGLEVESNLHARARALDFVAFVGEIARARRDDAGVGRLLVRAEVLRRRLASVDAAVIRRVRDWLRDAQPDPAAVRHELDRYTSYRPDEPGQAHYGFDGLDVLVAGLVGVTERPAETREPLTEMVHYEPSPARVVLDLIDHAGLTSSDVFYDLGSGLGYAVILARLAGGIIARGVEFQQSYVDVARRSVADLHLTDVDFVTADVRDADLSEGTIFYLFTPFRGQLMRQVLDRLCALATRRPITICTYGSCTRTVGAEAWLKLDDRSMLHDYHLGIFRSTVQ